MKNRSTVLSSNPTSRYRSQETEVRILMRYLHSHVHGSSSPDSQDMEASGQMGKTCVVYTCNGILFNSLSKEGNAATCDTMN